MIARTCWARWGWAAVLLFAAPPADAQAPPNPRADYEKPKGETATTKISGKIQGIRGDVVLVAGEDPQSQWLVKMPQTPKDIRVVGSATAAWLQPGMLVRFSGQFDSKGKPQAPINRVEVFTPHGTREGGLPEIPGVFAENAFGGNLFAGQEAAPQPAKEVQGYVIIGQLRGLRQGEMLVAAGNTSVKASLAEKPEIVVDVADPRWIKIGDEIEASGWYYPLIKNQVYATQATIRAAQPLGLGMEEGPKPVPPGTLPAKPGAVKPAPAKPGGQEELPF